VDHDGEHSRLLAADAALGSADRSEAGAAVIDRQHYHPEGLDADQRQLALHLLIEHDYCDDPSLLRDPLDELTQLHRRDHGVYAPVATGLFQWISSRPFRP
jgi:hypothetical protein